MLNKKELTKTDIIKCLVEGKITAKDASLRLKLSVRQVQRLKAKFREGVSLLHGNCGRMPSIALAPMQKQAILAEFCKPCYESVNFKHFSEIITNKPFSASYGAIYSLLKANGYESPKKRRKNKKKVHKTRERRAKFGELIQADGTPFDWFKSGKQQSLHVLIDDCTGNLTGLHMSENECLDGYFEATHQMLENFGTPEAFYADGLSVFFINSKQELTIDEQLAGVEERKTQFGEICETLGIELIHALSPQAKGRVERVNQTLQSRLPVEFALRKIDTIDAANDFLKTEFIPAFNAQFGVNSGTASCFVPLPSVVNLDELLAWKTTRKTDKGGVFSLNNVRFQTGVYGKTIDVLISKKLGIMAKSEGLFYDVAPISGNKKTITSSDSMEMIVARFVRFHTLKNEHIL